MGFNASTAISEDGLLLHQLETMFSTERNDSTEEDVVRYALPTGNFREALIPAGEAPPVFGACPLAPRAS
jgi:hypothetical protein